MCRALNYLTEVRAREQAVSIDVLRLEDELKREYDDTPLNIYTIP